MNDTSDSGSRSLWWRSPFAAAGAGVVILAVGFVVAYQFVEPAPPNHLVMATGDPDGAYHAFGTQFAAALADENITLELRPTAGAVENLALLNAENEIDLAFVQGGIATTLSSENVVSLGSMYLEPVWVFVRADSAFTGIRDITGLTVAVGEPGSGTRAIAMRLFAAFGADTTDTNFVGIASADLQKAFESQAIDLAIVIGSPESALVEGLVASDTARLMSIRRADALVRRYAYLFRLSLPQGVLDLAADLPAQNVETVALTAMLAANRNLQPALIDLLLVVAARIHGAHSLLSDAGEFPTPRYIDLPLSEEAERYYRDGPPFLQRYLPFWAATLVDRLWVMLLPVIGLMVPLVKLVPPLYQWRIRRKLLGMYKELQSVDPQIVAVDDGDDVADRVSRVETLERESVRLSVPKEYTDDVYKLRRDIDLVRRRLKNVSVTSAV